MNSIIELIGCAFLVVVMIQHFYQIKELDKKIVEKDDLLELADAAIPENCCCNRMSGNLGIDHSPECYAAWKYWNHRIGSIL